MLRILIIDDHPLVRTGMKHILEDLPGETEIFEASNAAEGMKQFREHKPDLVLLDINLPGRSGLDLLQDLKHIDRDIKVLMVSMLPEDQYAIRSMRTGASGYLTKESAGDELLEAVKKINRGGKYITLEMAERIFELMEKPGEPHETLSDREFETMMHIAKGKSIKETGSLLALSEKTISTYRSRILEKMGMNSNAELVRYCVEKNLID